MQLPFKNCVVELTDESTGELIYCYRTNESSFKAPVFSPGRYTLKAGANSGDKILLKNVAID